MDVKEKRLFIYKPKQTKEKEKGLFVMFFSSEGDALMVLLCQRIDDRNEKISDHQQNKIFERSGEERTLTRRSVRLSMHLNLLFFEPTFQWLLNEWSEVGQCTAPVDQLFDVMFAEENDDEDRL